MKPDLTTAPKVRTYVYAHEGYWAAIGMMANRMAVSEQKYGPIERNYPNTADALATLRQRLDRYEETGNTEWLLDAANMAVIEHLRPRRAGAHFRATDSDESPGLVR